MHRTGIWEQKIENYDFLMTQAVTDSQVPSSRYDRNK